MCSLMVKGKLTPFNDSIYAYIMQACILQKSVNG